MVLPKIKYQGRLNYFQKDKNIINMRKSVGEKKVFGKKKSTYLKIKNLKKKKKKKKIYFYECCFKFICLSCAHFCYSNEYFHIKFFENVNHNFIKHINNY